MSIQQSTAEIEELKREIDEQFEPEESADSSQLCCTKECITLDEFC